MRIFLVAAVIFLMPFCAAAQQNSLSASIVGRTWSVASEHARDWLGSHSVDLSASRVVKGGEKQEIDTHMAWDFGRSWFRGGVESRNRAAVVSAHAGAGFRVRRLEVDIGLTTQARPRTAVRWSETFGPVATSLETVLTEGVADVRAALRYRAISAEVWRLPGGEWMPRAALVAKW